MLEILPRRVEADIAAAKGKELSNNVQYSGEPRYPTYHMPMNIQVGTHQVLVGHWGKHTDGNTFPWSNTVHKFKAVLISPIHTFWGIIWAGITV